MLPLVYFKYHNDSNFFFANNTLLQLFLKKTVQRMCINFITVLF